MAGARPEEQDPGDPDATVRVLQWHSQGKSSVVVQGKFAKSGKSMT